MGTGGDSRQVRQQGPRQGALGIPGRKYCFYLVGREVESLTERASERMLSFSLIRAGCWVFVRQISPEGSELPSARFPPDLSRKVGTLAPVVFISEHAASASVTGS